MSRKILGLDIRNDSVSAVLLSSTLKGSHIDTLAHVNIPDNDDYEAALTNAVETITRRIDTTKAVCVTSLPASKCSFRNIKVPFKDKKKINQILPFELEPFLLFSVEDMITEFILLKADEQDENELITASIQRADIESLLSILEPLGIDPSVITFGGNSNAACLGILPDCPEDWILIDTGKSESTMFAFTNGQMCLVRNIIINSQSTSNTKNLCIEIQRTVNVLKDTRPDFQPKQILISGQQAFYPDIEEEITRSTGLPAKQSDLIYNSELSTERLIHNYNETEHLSDLDNAFALAFAEDSGINGFNFRKGDYAAKSFFRENSDILIRTGIIALIMFISVFLHLIIDINTKKHQLKMLDKKVIEILTTSFPDTTKIVAPLHQMKEKINTLRKTSALSDLSEKTIKTIDMLHDINSLIPKSIDVIISQIHVQSDKITLAGDTDTYNSVDDMKSRLEKSVFFRKVEIGSTTKKESRILFKLHLRLDNKS